MVLFMTIHRKLLMIFQSPPAAMLPKEAIVGPLLERTPAWLVTAGS
jgi:ABC-type antimicrobial peptide transport system ATPase subunit